MNDLDKPEPKFEPIPLSEEMYEKAVKLRIDKDAISKTMEDAVQACRNLLADNLHDSSKWWETIITENNIPKHLQKRLAVDMVAKKITLVEVDPDQDLADFLRSQ